MNKFFVELKRRNVVRIGIAYGVVSWVILQFVDVVAPLMGLSEGFQKGVLVLLAIGFPIALLLSWAYEVTPEGVKKTKEVDRSKTITHGTGKKLNKLIAAGFVMALAFIAYDKMIATDEVVVSEAQAAATSIAVLPFVNMSDDPSNVYFSDGISEELLNLLAKIPELRVISRTSAFSYKDKDIDTPTIAAELNVSYILEGSVRKSGSQVRITAQLIEAQSDTHIWSETFDRTLEDIFVTQDEIAARVVEQLKITLLGGAPTVQLTDPEAYNLVLQARYLVRQSTADSLEQAITLLEQALAIDPDYAAAWAGLARVYSSLTGQSLRPIDEGYTLAREAAAKALALDPEYAPAQESLARIARDYDRDLVVAARHYGRALALDPANTEIIAGAASMAASLGRLDQAIALAEYAVARDPVNPAGIDRLGIYYLYAGRLDEAIASLRTALALSPGSLGSHYLINTALVLKGEPEAALEVIQKETSETKLLYGLVTAYHALGDAAASDMALTELIEKYEQDAAYNIAYLLAFRGEANRAFEWLDKAVVYNDPGLSQIAIWPQFANIHEDPRWLPFLESIGKSPEQLAAIEFNVTLPE
ncbi:MAG: tetratricopeptide repeat protein [Sphingomonadales bacterium]